MVVGAALRTNCHGYGSTAFHLPRTGLLVHGNPGSAGENRLNGCGATLWSIRIDVTLKRGLFLRPQGLQSRSVWWLYQRAANEVSYMR